MTKTKLLITESRRQEGGAKEEEGRTEDRANLVR